MKKYLLIIMVILAATLAYGQTVIGYTSFEEPSTGEKYTDATQTDHALANHAGQADVVYTSIGGELGFSAYYTNTISDVGLSDGDYIGVTSYTPDGGTMPDGDQAYQLSDCDGLVTVSIDPAMVTSTTTVYYSFKYFVKDDGWEATDYIKIWLIADGTTETIILNTTGNDIDDTYPTLEGEWKTAAGSLSINSSLQLKFELQSNAGNEAIWVDDIQFTTGGSIPVAPIAVAGADQTVFVGETVTMDGSASSDADNNIMSYSWEQTYGTAIAPTLTNADSAVCTFTAPITPQDYSFELIVTDSTGLVDRDTINIAVREPVEAALLFSEYIEGSSNNKAYEIYNYSDVAVDLAPYEVKVSRDGAGWGNYAVGDSREALVLDLSGTLDPGDVYVVARTEADAAILAVADITFEYSNELAGAYTVCFTGNDALGLFLNDVLVDVIGDPGVGSNFAVAGVPSATADHTLIRKPDVFAGNTDWTTSAGTNEDNSGWIVQAQDSFSDLGSHMAGPVAYTFSNSTVTTAFPQAGSEISISIDITPDEGVSAPTTVKVFYGTGGTQANQADMWLESGTTYAGSIPALSSGNVVLDYYISAIGTETINSSLYNMTVAGTIVDIADIHTNILTYDGMTKTIEGVITIGAGVLRDDRTSAYIQDESGRGLNLYTGTLLTDLTRGTKVKLVGTVTAYYTTVEIADFEYSIVSTGQTLPAAMSVTPAGANSASLEGTLATITGTYSKLDDYGTSKNMILTSGTDSAIVKVWPTTGIDPSSYTLGTDYAITGVGSQYSGEYQLLVGYTTDITDNVAICEDCTPETFALNKAYPNPFNPMTTIEFSLTEAGPFEISVYNITGQRVDVLSSSYAEPGVYKQTWNAGDFTSGVYFIRLVAGQNIATQKVVLIK